MGRLVRVPQRANDDLPIAGLEGVLEPASTTREAVPSDLEDMLRKQMVAARLPIS
jgi:hypothetical protein